MQQNKWMQNNGRRRVHRMYKRKVTKDGKEIKSYVQQMYKVGYGPNLWGIISEDSLNRYTYLEGCIEEYGTRTLYYIEQEEEGY